MKFILFLFITCAIAKCSNAQSLPIDSLTKAPADSLAVFKVGAELDRFMRENNLGIKDYQLVVNVYNAFIQFKQKDFIKPKGK